MVFAENRVSVHQFRGSSGNNEYYITCEAPDGSGLDDQVAALARGYAEALQNLRLSPASGVFRRIYLSDAANQAPLVRQSSLFQEPLQSPVAVSIVQQPPLPGGKVAMLAYHVDGPAPVAKRVLSDGHMLMQRGSLGHLWSTRLCAGESEHAPSTGGQTRLVFDRLIEKLTENAANLAENCVRTWIYVKDVDVFYQEMVDARSELFNRHGLTRETHYIASTGIEGSCAHRYDTVLMDAYSILGLRPEQMSYLNDFSRLCATKDYNVTFERGTRIGYADRAHHFISGTASIDPDGMVLHRGDVYRQLERALGNVDALLRSGNASLADMTHFIVYLRDASDYPRIAGYFEERFPGIPRLMLRGAVCRPDWLVEVEGIAVTPEVAPHLPEF